ncbi:MAG: hypothetical protein AAF671_03650 [Pseudomonadota bacterium]
MVIDFHGGHSGSHSGDAAQQQKVFLALGLGLALIAASATHGQEQDQNRSLLKTAGFEARHTFSVGAMPLEADASILAATEALPPAEITLEDLGVDDSYDSFFLEYRYRLGSRWSTFVGAYRFSSSGGREISRDLNYDGVEFSAGADVRAELTADAYMVDLLYSVYKTDTFEVQLGGGLHAFDLNAEIRSEVFVGDANATVSQAGETLLAPIPNFRGSASWALSERFGFTLVGGWLSANIDEFEGDFTYAHLRGHYRVSDNFGVSLGYLYNEVDVTENRERGDLVYDIIFKGPSITLTFGF